MGSSSGDFLSDGYLRGELLWEGVTLVIWYGMRLKVMDDTRDINQGT